MKIKSYPVGGDKIVGQDVLTTYLSVPLDFDRSDMAKIILPVILASGETLSNEDDSSEASTDIEEQDGDLDIGMLYTDVLE